MNDLAHFAAQALQGLIVARSTNTGATPRAVAQVGFLAECSDEVLVKRAWEIADLMVTEQSTRKPAFNAIIPD